MGQGKIFNLPTQIRKNLHNSLKNLEEINGTILRRKFINHQRREAEKNIEREVKRNMRRNQKCKRQL
jgi:hypothetical protein